MKKVAIITGASSGIGKKTVIELLKSGYTVYGVARNLEKMKDIEEMGAKIISIDVTDEESMANGIFNLIENEGRIDVLVNNAGYGFYGTVEDVPIEDARKQFEVNVFGLARMTQLVLPVMRKQHSGKIVNISSVAGKMSIPLGGWYHASKHAIEALSDSLRLEVKSFGIDVIIIEPGIIKTDWWNITRDNLEKVSKHSAYKDLIEKAGNYLKMDDSATDPIEIAQLISKVIELKKPKARYAKGYMANTIITGKKVLSDSLFDKAIESQMKI